MVRISRLADYGILLMTTFSHEHSRHGGAAHGEAAGGCLAATSLAQETALPLPTVSKLLQALCRAGLLHSQRGAHGGYRLARPASAISVADIITALEGPIALTDCLSHGGPTCEVESLCPTRSNWDRINAAIRTALGSITLEEMARPQRGWSERLGTSLVGAARGRDR
jgi:FeS assembly SUF system regulator